MKNRSSTSTTAAGLFKTLSPPLVTDGFRSRSLPLTAATCILLALILAASPARLPATEFAFTTTTDYTTGSSSVIRLDGSYTNNNDVTSVCSDAVSRYYGGMVYVVNRMGCDNIQVLDPTSGFSTRIQFSVGNGSNPIDIAFLTETKAYVTRNESNELWIVDPTSGDHTGTIDLSSFADGDGICEMDHLFMMGDRLFVTIQRVDRDNWWLPVGDSYVAVIDCAADTLIDTDPLSPGKQSILLTGTNPFNDIQHDPATNRLYVSCVGTWGVADGGVEIINPYTYESEGYIITESAGGGDITDAEMLSAVKGYAIIATPSFFTELISFNPATGTKTGTIYAPGDWVLNDIEISPDGDLFVADQTATNPGIWIYGTGTDTLITPDPINLGLPPFDICFSIPAFAGTDTPRYASLSQNYPNPFNPTTRIRFTLPGEETVSFAIYDITGKRIRTLVERSRLTGTHEMTWDGRDDAGRQVASGVYLFRLVAGGRVETKKAVLLR